MAVKIKLIRFGRKKRPTYRIVVAEAKSKATGKTIDTIGFYNPLTEPNRLKDDKEKLEKWLSYGVQPTDAVRKLLKL